MKVINNAIEFYRIIKTSPKFEARFKKKDGTIRILNGTLDFEKIPKSKQPKKVDNKKILKLLNDHGIVHVFDIDKDEWRSINFNTTDWVETEPGTKFRITKK